MAEHIYLIGLPGVGKTAIGELLARRLGLPFADLDARLVEALEMPITDFFARHGEAAFREAESAALRAASLEPAQVVSTGGGIVLRAENRERMRQTGRVVLLERELEAILESLSGDARPLLLGDARTRLEALARERQALYEACAHVRLRNDTPPEETVARLLAKIKI